MVTVWSHGCVYRPISGGIKSETNYKKCKKKKIKKMKENKRNTWRPTEDLHDKKGNWSSNLHHTGCVSPWVSPQGSIRHSWRGPTWFHCGWAWGPPLSWGRADIWAGRPERRSDTASSPVVPSGCHSMPETGRERRTNQERHLTQTYSDQKMKYNMLLCGRKDSVIFR